MGRIPNEEIERLKREIPVRRLAEACGVELKAHGKDLIGLCPFHEDHEPSLVITPEKNLWHCLGACGTGGSVIDWVIRAEGVSFRHAVELLRRDFSASAGGNPSPPVRRSLVPKLPPVFSLDAEDREVLRQVVAYYHKSLKESPEALGYLEKRGLASSEMIDRFKLGFSNRTLGYRLPARRTRAGEEIRSRLQRLGILRASGHEHFNGSLVVPIFDEAGEVAEVYGRKVRDDLRDGTPKHLYLPGPHRGVWNREALEASREVILCEALIDALTFWCAGFRNVTACYGTSGFTEDHLAAFKTFGTTRVLIAFDRDDPGDRAAEALAARLLSEGIGCSRILFPRNMDANEYTGKVQSAEKSLGLLIQNALWLGGSPQGQDVEDPRVEGPPQPEHRDVSPLAAGFDLDPASSSGPERAANRESIAAACVQPQTDVFAEVKADEVVIRLGDRRWRVRGLSKNTSLGLLRVNVLCTRGEGFHVETLDLYSARQRAIFVKEAAEELAVKDEVVKKDLGRVLLKLEELQEEEIRKALAPKTREVVLSEAERAEALRLLEAPDLLDRIVSDFDRCGIVGEAVNKLMGYLAAVSRKLEDPLAVIVQSSSAAGKSSLLEAILAFTPEEDRVKYSAMTGQSLFYMGATDLRGKILAIVEEEGAERASYALKLLQSEGELTIASTGKDPATGRFVTHEYEVRGPVMILLTTTALEIEEEFLNRCLVLSVDEDREQTRAIHRLQRESQTLQGLLQRSDRERILKLHQNAQRLLRPIPVANPYAPSLTFLDLHTRTRRDHMKYLTLIRTIALLRQFQKPIREAAGSDGPMHYIEVGIEDIEVANGLASEVLGRSLDELPPQGRRFLALLDRMVSEACERLAMDRSDFRFSRKDVRAYTGWSDFQVKSHMGKLEDLEYVLIHRGGRGQSLVYELLYRGEGQDGKPFLMGLIDPKTLEADYDKKKEHPKAGLEHANLKLEHSGRHQGASKEPQGRVSKIAGKVNHCGALSIVAEEAPKNPLPEAAMNSSSYRSFGRGDAVSPLAGASGPDANGDGR